MLTAKELKVLKLHCRGFTQVQIARKLSISQPAVSSFYNNIVRKVGDAKDVLKTAREVGFR